MLRQTDHSFTAAFLSKITRFGVENARKVSNLVALFALNLNRTFLPKNWLRARIVRLP